MDRPVEAPTATAPGKIDGAQTASADSDGSTDPGHDAPAWIITLVHGTWGRSFIPQPSRPGKEYWFEAGSSFRKDLDRQLSDRGLGPVEFETIEWSGSNSLTERSKAAARLARQLVAQHARAPQARLLVIGHSHGGNVALDVANHILMKDLPVSVVTLATPFLEVTAPSRWVWNEERMMLVGMLLAIAPNLWRMIPAGWPPWTMLLPAVPIVAAANWLTRAILREHWLRQREIVTPVDELEALASHTNFHRDGVPLLVLRGIDDEASLAISTALVGRRVSHLMRDVLSAVMAGRVTRWVVGVATALALGVWALTATGSSVPRLLSIMFEAYYWTVLAIFGCIVFANLCTTAVGRELAGFYNLEISVNSAPDARRHVWIRTLKREGARRGFLRHGLYNEPWCAAEITSWMKGGEFIYKQPSIGDNIIVNRIIESAHTFSSMKKSGD